MSEEAARAKRRFSACAGPVCVDASGFAADPGATAPAGWQAQGAIIEVGTRKDARGLPVAFKFQWVVSRDSFKPLLQAFHGTALHLMTRMNPCSLVG